MFEPLISEEHYPLSVKLVECDGIVTFEDQIDDISQRDLEFLGSIRDCYCAYGAMDSSILPFTCGLAHALERNLPTCEQVLHSLSVTHFKSQHISHLAQVNIDYPGYQPNTENDEIHTDSVNQYIFNYENPEEYSFRLHQKLKDCVIDEHLYYVLIHDLVKYERSVGARSNERLGFSSGVVLFAVGVSKRSGRLMGVVTSQACHNLCD